MRAVGYYMQNGILANSDGEVVTQPPYLDFLLEPKPDATKVFYHFGHNTANLFKAIELTKEEAQKLLNEGKLWIAPYSLEMIPNKSLSIRKGSWWTFISDASQYIPTTFLVEQATIPYCLQKAEDARLAGDSVILTLEKLGLHPKSIVSPISAFEKEQMGLMELSTIDHIPEKAGEYAYECCKGNWLECFTQGHWDCAYDYDVNSAYPYIATQLPDIRKGKWIHSVSPDSDAFLGYCYGELQITAPFTPFVYKKNHDHFKGLNYTPTGKWMGYLTLSELLFLKKWNLGAFRMVDGWWWVPKGLIRHPTESAIKLLHQKKERAKGIERETIKRIMAGIYGKFLETRGNSFGKWFNPVYAAEIETQTRMNLVYMAFKNDVKPLHIAVDGMITDRPLSFIGTSPFEFGSFYLANEGKCFIVGTGVVAMEHREKTAEFSLDYNWMKKAIETEPLASSYEMTKNSPMTLSLALATNNYDKLGDIVKINRTVHIGQENKRCYRSQPKTGIELINGKYESIPWDVSVIGK